MNIEDRIFEEYEKKNAKSKPRNYLGGSIIGGCERKLWFAFRKMFDDKFEGRILRLFQYGHDAEKRFINELRSIGMHVSEFDIDTGKQYKVTGLRGWFSGHADGIIELDGENALIEFKTHNDKSFNSLVKDKVKESKPDHYAQMQVYMGKLDLKKSLYFAENKNTSDLYTEWVDFDVNEYRSLMAKAKRIITESRPPTDDVMPADKRWTCRWCPANDLCKQEAFPLVNCMSCCYSELGDSPIVTCKRNGKAIPDHVISKGCGLHLFNPMAMPLDYVDADPGEWVSYRLPSGLLMYNATATAMPPIDETSKVPQIFTSQELSGKPCNIGK